MTFCDAEAHDIKLENLLRTNIDCHGRLRRYHLRTTHVLVLLAEFGTTKTKWTALFDNVFNDLLETPVVILVTRDPWWFPDMQSPWMAKDMVREIFVGFETFINCHVEAT